MTINCGLGSRIIFVAQAGKIQNLAILRNKRIPSPKILLTRIRILPILKKNFQQQEIHKLFQTLKVNFLLQHFENIKAIIVAQMYGRILGFSWNPHFWKARACWVGSQLGVFSQGLLRGGRVEMRLQRAEEKCIMGYGFRFWSEWLAIKSCIQGA